MSQDMDIALNALFPKEQILTPADGAAYEDAIKRWADNAVRRAQYVVFPKSTEDVSKAVSFASTHNLELAIKGGGHSCSGASSSTGLVIDLSAHLTTVSVDATARLLTVGGGANWADVDSAAAKHGLATVGGTVNHTGVGGLTVGGGYGWLTGRYGLTIDNLVKAEVVTASGDVVVCSAEPGNNDDLFWGIRGGGSNFGVVTSFVFKAYPQTNPIWSGLLVYLPQRLEALVIAVSTWAKASSPDESMMIVFACPPPIGDPAIVVIPFFNGSAIEARECFKAVLDVGPVADMTKEMAYEEVNAVQNPMATYDDRKLFKAVALTALEPTVIRGLFDAYCEGIEEYPGALQSAVILELHNYQKLMEIPGDAMAFANRGPWYNVNIALRWQNAELDVDMRTWSSSLAARLHQEQAHADREKPADIRGNSQVTAGEPVRPSGYSNYGLGDERVRDVFGANYDRLRVLKAKYDPAIVFNKWFPIAPRREAE